MGIEYAQEISTGREGSDETSGKKDTHRRARIFRVVTENPTDGQDLVLAACPLPMSAYPDDHRLVLTSRRAVQDGKTKTVWIVTLTYSLGDSTSDQGNPQQPNPLDDSRQIDWSTETRQEPTHQDADGKAILNSAGDYFENGVMRDVTSWIVTIVQNVPEVPDWIDDYRDAVNDDQSSIEGDVYPAKSMKVRSIKLSRWQVRNDVAYRQLTIVIAIRDTWHKKILDEGLHALNGNGGDPDYGKRMAAVNANGQKVTRPVLLDGAGHVLANPTPATAQFIDVKLYNEKDFSVLPIH